LKAIKRLTNREGFVYEEKFTFENRRDVTEEMMFETAREIYNLGYHSFISSDISPRNENHPSPLIPP